MHLAALLPFGVQQPEITLIEGQDGPSLIGRPSKAGLVGCITVSHFVRVGSVETVAPQILRDSRIDVVVKVEADRKPFDCHYTSYLFGRVSHV